jgi:hypothetical protein
MRPVRHARFERIEKLQALTQTANGIPPVTSSFVYQPGGTAHGNVFTSFPELMDAVSRTPGIKSILVDGTFSSALSPVPAGTWNVDNCTFYGYTDPVTGFVGVLQFEEGARFTGGTTYFYNIILRNNSSTAPFTYAGNGAGLYFIEAALQSNPGKAPCIHATATTTHFTLIGVHEVVLGEGTTPVLQCDAPTEIEVQLSNHSIVFANATLGTGTIDFEYDSDTNLFFPQAGTIAFLPQGKAANTTYTPANLANWSGVAPTNVADALDRIAAKITPIP